MLSKETKEQLMRLAKQDVLSAEGSLRMAVWSPCTEVEVERFKAWGDRAKKLVVELEKEWSQC